MGSNVKKYKCSKCGGTFYSPYPYQEAIDECIENFGEYNPETDVIVCDVCYKEIMEFKKRMGL